MARRVLLWGMLAGLCGGVLAAGFAEVAAEPAIDAAIAFEESQAAHPHDHGSAGHSHESEPVSREVQRAAGLPVAAGLYGVAVGGLFGLGFAVAYGRVGSGGPAKTAAWLAAIGFAVVVLVPFVKYPANPPAVGDPNTVDTRTQLFLIMIAISILIAVAAVRLLRSMQGRWSPPVAALLAAGAYAAIVTAAAIALPAAEAAPRDFPASTLWEFRAAALGTQAVLWAAMGLTFAIGARRALDRGRARVGAERWTAWR